MNTKTTFPAHPCPVSSPWGMVEDSMEIAPGIWRFSTMSHGGFWLSPERQQHIPASLAQITWLRSIQWFEEDVDAAWVMVAFPEHFIESDVRAARYMLSAYTSGKNTAVADIAAKAMQTLNAIKAL